MGFYKYIKQIKEDLHDQKYNREFVGQDRDGNKFYQYYSSYGLPTRREIEFADKSTYELKDIAFYDWMYKRVDNAPTPQELDQYYEQLERRKMLGKQWDEQEMLLQKQYYEQFKLNNQKQQRQFMEQNLDSESLGEKERLLLEEEKQNILKENQNQEENQQEQNKTKAWNPNNQKSKRSK